MQTLLIAFLLALTDTQVDAILTLVGKLIDHIPGILTMLATFFLIIRQWLNKKEISEKIDANTEVSVNAFNVANGHNAKIVEAQELAKAAIDTVQMVVKTTTAPKEVTVKSDSEHPVHTTGGKGEVI